MGGVLLVFGLFFLWFWVVFVRVFELFWLFFSDGFWGCFFCYGFDGFCRFRLLWFLGLFGVVFGGTSNKRPCACADFLHLRLLDVTCNVLRWMMNLFGRGGGVGWGLMTFVVTFKQR